MPRLRLRVALVASLLVALAALPASPVRAQSDASPGTASPDATPPDTALGLDPAVRTGQLDNGLRYFIRPNDEPQNRVELRLVVNAGSILEDDDQRGLAHFVEHMLFNGTEQFEKNELIDFLERLGMQFGPDVNAYTSFDETVYQLTVPTDSAAVVERSFDVLEQWAAHATFDAEEIERERGVIIAEWRARLQNASGRLQNQTRPVLFGPDSRYARRLPIGDTTIVRNASRDTIVDYYRTWYRPNLMSVVVVGDLDPDRAEALIRARFAPLQNPPNAEPRRHYALPAHDSTRYVVATDPEFPASVVQVTQKTPADTLQTVQDFRTRLVRQLFFGMLSSRLDEKARTGEAPFLQANAGSGGRLRPTAFHALTARVPDDSVLTGTEALVREMTRVRQHGFTSTELVRRKRSVEDGYENAYNDRANVPSSQHAREYASLFLEGDAVPGIEAEYRLVQALLPTISLEAVNRLAETIFTEANRVVTARMPASDSLPAPTEADLAAALDRAQSADVAPYDDAVSDLPLIASVPGPADVTATTQLDSIDATEWTLANGVRVVLKPTDFKADEVRFTASSPGGLSQVPDSAYAQARHAASVVGRSGVGSFSQTALEKKLAGKSVRVSASIGDRREGLSGSASPTDLETLFQLIHLSVTAPRVDGNALTAYQNEQRAYLRNRSRAPGAVFQDSLFAALYGDHPRVGPPTLDEIDALDADRLLSVYRERFADAGDFTFTFAGNVSPDSLETLARTYLGTLPATARTDSVRDVQPDLPDGVVTKTVESGLGQRSIVLRLYHGPFDDTRANRHRLSTLADVLQIRLREELREKRSGVYNVGVSANSTGAPDPRYTVSVSFLSDPSRADELVGAARAVIDSVRTGHVRPADVDKVKEQQLRSRETALETNGFWVSALDFVYQKPDMTPRDILTYDALVDAVTPASVAETARTYLLDDRVVEARLVPGASGGASDGSGSDGSSAGGEADDAR